MNSKSHKRDRIHGILAGEIETDSPRIDRSELGKLVNQSPPKFAPSELHLVLPPLLLGSFALLFAWFAPIQFDSTYARAVPALTIIIIFLWLLHCQKVRSAEIKKYSAGLSKAVDELQNLKDYLARYLKALDERTSRYFHCVTNTKVTTYFILMQIEAAIGERISEVRAQLNTASTHSTQEAFYKLHGNLLFQDGAIRNQGDTHLVPLARLSEVIPALVQNLEAGLIELEKEIELSKGLLQEKGGEPPSS